MTWQIDLVGEALDIGELQKLALLYECSIDTGPDGRPSLSSPKFSSLSDAREVTEAAGKVLAVLNGIARTRHANHRPVQLGPALSRTNAKGGRHVAVLLEGAEIRMRAGDLTMKVTRADGSTEMRGTGDNAEDRAKKILADPRLHEIVEAISSEISWQRLRIAYEKINALIGKGDNAFVKHGYATQDELRRFKANVEDPRHSGLDAVHGVPQSSLKGTSMSTDEGFVFVVRLLNTFLDQLN